MVHWYQAFGTVSGGCHQDHHGAPLTDDGPTWWVQVRAGMKKPPWVRGRDGWSGGHCKLVALVWIGGGAVLLDESPAPVVAVVVRCELV
jgi:hypothetical protein